MGTIALLLQLTTSLLMGVEHNPQISIVTQQQAVNVASRVVQLSTQALADIPFPVPQNNGIWPNITDLENAPYRGPQNAWVPLGQGVQLISSSTSFGDINGDGVDDAVALVEEMNPNGSSNFAWAAFLNQGGIMFNIADTPLGSVAPTIYSHTIQDGEFVVDMQSASNPRTTYHYTLLGNSFESQ